MERFFPKDKILLTGNPVRQDILNLSHKRNEALAYFNLKNELQTVLVIGGSLGARTINQVIEKMLPYFKENNIQLIWQTGKYYAEKAKQAVNEINAETIITMPFISRMDYAYAAANIVISRAGALSVSEIAVAKKPAIFIPSPNVAEDHQTKNAMALVNHHAAIMVKDDEAQAKLKNELDNLLNDKNLQNELIKNITPLGKPNAADDIANEILKLADR